MRIFNLNFDFWDFLVSGDDVNLTKLIHKYNLPEYQQEWNYYNAYDLEYDSHDLYFNIQPFKSTVEKNPEIYHKIQDVFILDKKHYKSVIDKISSENDFKTPLKSVYKTDLDHIKDIIETTLVERLHELKKERLQVA